MVILRNLSLDPARQIRHQPSAPTEARPKACECGCYRDFNSYRSTVTIVTLEVDWRYLMNFDDIWWYLTWIDFKAEHFASPFWPRSFNVSIWVSRLQENRPGFFHCAITVHFNDISTYKNDISTRTQLAFFQNCAGCLGITTSKGSMSFSLTTRTTSAVPGLFFLGGATSFVDFQQNSLKPPGFRPTVWPCLASRIDEEQLSFAREHLTKSPQDVAIQSLDIVRFYKKHIETSWNIMKHRKL